MRTVQILNHLGSRYRHTMVAFDADFSASPKLQSAVPIEYVVCRNTGNPLQMIRKIRGLLRQLRPQLILTYNWGAMDAVAANWLFRFCPLIHTEDGFDVDEASRQLPRRVFFRRMFLPHAHQVVVPSETLLGVVLEVWKLSPGQALLLPNGVDLERFSAGAGTTADRGDVMVGSVGNLKPVKRQRLLIDAFAAAAERLPARLLLAGEGPDRPMLESRAEELGVRQRVNFLGLIADTAPVYRKLDIFALSSETEQMPLTVLEAMATGLPVVSTDVGDVKAMVSEPNRPFIVPAAEYQAALQRLVEDAELRRKIGEANRRHCAERFDERQMLGRYEKLFQKALGKGT